MEDKKLRIVFESVTDSMVNKLKKNKKCVAAILLGSISHDVIWKWSDLQMLAIYEEDYKGPKSYELIENDIYVCLNIMTYNDFTQYLGNIDMADYYICALSKGKILFCKDIVLQEVFNEAFYIGDKDREIEMLLGFSNAVYYLNKAEKNLYHKDNLNNAIYFIPLLNEGLAWIEVAKQRMFPEREIIEQGSKLNPDLFKKTYYPLFEQIPTYNVINQILNECVNYLHSNTLEVYKPIINYLKEKGNLRDFRLKTRPHGFGINYEWLVRSGICERYGEPIKIDNQLDTFFHVGYRLLT